MAGDTDCGGSKHRRVKESLVLGPQDNQIASLIAGGFDNFFGRIALPERLLNVTSRPELIWNPLAKPIDLLYIESLVGPSFIDMQDLQLPVEALSQRNCML